MVNRECAHHDWCNLGKISKYSEINPSQPNLNILHLAFVLFVLPRVLALIWLTGLRTFLKEMSGTPTIKAVV